MGMKQKNKNFEKKIQNGLLKKTEFFKIAHSQNIFAKISWIGPLISRIDWWEGHWCGSTYIVEKLSDVSSKTGKNAFFVFFACFWAYVGQPHSHMRHITALYINQSYWPKDQFMKFSQKIFENWRFWKTVLFELAILDFFLHHRYENWSKFLGYIGWVEMLMIILVSSQKSLPKKFQLAVYIR
jgi:hypothetical protein